MEIVHYPHPALRWKSSDVRQIDANLRKTVREMFDLMYAAKGIGLAANQVALPLRLFIVNPTGEAGQPEEEHVFINPVITNRKGAEIGEEGCLSLPGLYSDVRRAETIVVDAFDIDGQPIRATLSELPARLVQHETDHLDGVLFIDRLEESLRREVDAKLTDFETRFRKQQAAGEIPHDEELLERLKSFGESAA
ncbi:MAG: peptide deformylase [Planctomycetota bacterium]|nr:MAG: peptide deformylase [Planctomycetota bacterium]REJ94301.1 MAG: peptide deformylase [Planctomycetota bacterium]REK23170.1 MAG: peptide deformylase [Planctomycetota bacterium]REK30915.1 MAG: peptide deformylase [Planctomycetota bacterium]